MRRKTHGSSSHSKVLVTDNRGRIQSKGPQSKSKNRSKSKSKYKNLTCHYCNKTGHIQKQCFLWKKEKKGKQERKENNSDCVSTATLDDLLIVGQESTINIASNESCW